MRQTLNVEISNYNIIVTDDSIQKMMEGSDLVDEFTYVEESSGAGWNRS